MKNDLFTNVLDTWQSVMNEIPPVFQKILYMVILVACINIVFCLVKAIKANINNWKPRPGTELMFSFSSGSGFYQLQSIIKDSHRLLFDRKWSLISFAGMAYRLGNLENISKVILFLCSIAYIPLTVLGMVEMIIRGIVGLIVYAVLNTICLIVLILCGLINAVLMPVFIAIDKSTRVEQHCPNDYATFKLPDFICPYCGKVHKNLAPGRSGLVFARCSCGRFISCASISGRKRLTAVCPKCGITLATSNVKQLSIQVIGGNKSGKTSFLAAYQHEYLEANRFAKAASIQCHPQYAFDELEKMFAQGYSLPSDADTVTVYTLVHSQSSMSDDSLVFYDIPDEILLSEQYEKNPLNFGYSDGVIVIIDPLSIPSVRSECIKNGYSVTQSMFSDDDPENIIIHFINKYSEIAGRSAKRMSRVPVAVLIAKTDITSINRRIGSVKIKTEYKANPSRYSGNVELARDSICRQYLYDIGLSNAVNNLESVFSKVSYYPISSIGHMPSTGTCFEPFGVGSPVCWIADQCNVHMSSTIKTIWDTRG